MFYQRLYRDGGSGFSKKPCWLLESIILFKLLAWFSEHECYRKEVILLFSGVPKVFMLLSTFFSELRNIWGCKGASGDGLLHLSSSRQYHLKLVTQVLFQLGLEYLQGWRLHSLSGQPMPVFDFPHSERITSFACPKHNPGSSWCPLLLGTLMARGQLVVHQLPE